MIEVGVRELKNSLSSYLRKVKEGETLVVTDRGEPVARVIPSGISPQIAKLMAEGRIKWSGKPVDPPPPLITSKPGPTGADYISEDRGI